MSDLLRKRIRVKEGRHHRLMGQVFGLIEAQQALEDIQKDCPKLPGLRLALAEVEALMHRRRAELAVANIRLAASEGIDVGVWTVTGLEAGGGIILEPYSAEEADEDGEG